MPRPRREEFILDVRRSARTLQKPTVEADSDAVDTDAIARILHQAALWLTPKVVASYHPDDFAGWHSDQRNRLHVAVGQFRDLASQVPANLPPTVEQFMEGIERFRELIKVLGGMVLQEWLSAIDAVERQAEEWSGDAQWRTRRINKKISETLLGQYDATQLLIFAEPSLYVLDPVARFVRGAQGAFDFAIQPSYYLTSISRDDRGKWYVHLKVKGGVAKGRQVPWSQQSFYKSVEELSQLA